MTNLKTLIFSFAIIGILSFNANAQDPKFRNYYKVPEVVQTDLYKMSYSSIISTMLMAKMGMTIENTGKDYLVYNFEEANFKYDFGDNHPEPRVLFIRPGEKKKRTLKVEGNVEYLAESYTLETSGLYKVAKDGKPVAVENFQLPAAKNTIEVGNFTISLVKLKKETKETNAKFECTYNGDKIAIVNPSKLSITVDGKEDMEYANDNKKAKDLLMKKGDKVKFNATFHIPGKIVDMQFATMYILWNNTFMESELEKLKVAPVQMILDPGMTKAKN